MYLHLFIISKDIMFSSRTYCFDFFLPGSINREVCLGHPNTIHSNTIPECFHKTCLYYSFDERAETIKTSNEVTHGESN